VVQDGCYGSCGGVGAGDTSACQLLAQGLAGPRYLQRAVDFHLHFRQREVFLLSF
jgi:hypothetical protein